MAVELWATEVQISGTIVHGTAILVTTIRLMYRSYMSMFWWEDTWAALALICDIGCLVSVWTQQTTLNEMDPPRIDIISNWLLSVTITCIVWFARMSILSSIVRIANPVPKLRRLAYCIGALFLAMTSGLLAQKLVICEQQLCHFTNAVALAQLVTDIISDIILVAVPVRFLRDIKISRDQRILILSAFSASILITGVTIPHSVLLLEASTTETIIIGHVKAALALLVCNALVIVTFFYRIMHKSKEDLERSIARNAALDSSTAQFTSVIEFPSRVNSYALSALATPTVNGRIGESNTYVKSSELSGSENLSRPAKSITFRQGDSDAEC